MNKNNYDLLNEIDTGVDQLPDSSYPQLSDSEINQLMNRFHNEEGIQPPAPKKRRNNLSVILIAAAILLIAASVLGFGGLKNWMDKRADNESIIEQPDNFEEKTEQAEIDDKEGEDEDKKEASVKNQADKDKTDNDKTEIAEESDLDKDKKAETDDDTDLPYDMSTAKDDIHEPWAESPGSQNTTPDYNGTEDEYHTFSIVSANVKYMDDLPEFASVGDAVYDSSQDKEMDVSVWNANGDLDCNWTRIVFNVMGNNISKVHYSIDKGALYTQTKTDINVDEFLSGRDSVESYGITVDRYNTWAIFNPFGTILSIDLVSVMGNDFTLDYDPDQKIGFFIPYETTAQIYAEMQEENETINYENCVNTIDGAILTIEATFSDGVVLQKKYKVCPGHLKYYTTESGFMIPVSEFADSETNDYVYGIILEEIN